MSRWKKNTMTVLTIKNGANGISVFIVILCEEKNMITKLTTAPIQNESVSIASPASGPSIHPRPRISFASPRPMSLPRDTSHSNANGNAKSGPDTSANSDGTIKNDPNPLVFIKTENNDTPAYIYTNRFGIILCRISYTDSTISKENKKEKRVTRAIYVP